MNDPLEVLARCRAALIAVKTRDFAAEIEAKTGRKVPAETIEVLSLATGQPELILGRADLNARNRKFERDTFATPSYQLARLRAMRRVSRLAQTDMLAMAQRCVNATEDMRADYAAMSRWVA